MYKVIKNIVIDSISKDTIEAITKILIICIDTILYDSEVTIELLKTYYKEINTDVNGKIFLKIEDQVLFVYNIKEETIEVFINRIPYTKRLMSLSLLRYCNFIWTKKEIQEMYKNKNYSNLNKINETKEYIYSQTPLKYLKQLQYIGINTKEIFT